jgi:hypothetical protein
MTPEDRASTNDFNVISIAFFKAETDAPLVVDANAPLTLAVMSQCFQPVRRGNA